MTPQRGHHVQVLTAYNETLTMVALTGPMAGSDFPVVWVCPVSDWERDGEGAQGIPWPLDAVQEPTTV